MTPPEALQDLFTFCLQFVYFYYKILKNGLQVLWRDHPPSFNNLRPKLEFLPTFATVPYLCGTLLVPGDDINLLHILWRFLVCQHPVFAVVVFGDGEDGMDTLVAGTLFCDSCWCTPACAQT